MKYRPDAQYAAARDDAADDALPAGQEAYFLRSGEGPRHELGGQLQTLLVGAEQSSGTMTMTTVELAKGPGLPAHVHERTYESLMVLEGRLRVVLDGEEHVLTRGDTASIPAGTEHAYAGEGHYTKVLTMSAPGGLEKLIATAGAATDEHVFGAAGRSTSTRCAPRRPSWTSRSSSPANAKCGWVGKRVRAGEFLHRGSDFVRCPVRNASGTRSFIATPDPAPRCTKCVPTRPPPAPLPSGR